MTHIAFKKYFIAATAITVLTLATHAYAQYVWLDDKGVKQYSDMAPPSSVPKSRILKQPRSVSGQASEPAVTAAGETSAAAASASAASTKEPMTTAEKNADFQKRKAEQAEKDKKEADKAKLAADKAKNCEQARAYNRALQSGERIARTDKNGERTYITDEQRAQEERDNRRVLDECK